MTFYLNLDRRSLKKPLIYFFGDLDPRIDKKTREEH